MFYTINFKNNKIAKFLYNTILILYTFYIYIYQYISVYLKIIQNNII